MHKSTKVFRGYQLDDRQSKKAILFLKWMAYTQYPSLQYKNSALGEKRLQISPGKFVRLDGYVERMEEGDRPLAIEVNGCYWLVPLCVLMGGLMGGGDHLDFTANILLPLFVPHLHFPIVSTSIPFPIPIHSVLSCLKIFAVFHRLRFGNL